MIVYTGNAKDMAIKDLAKCSRSILYRLWLAGMKNKSTDKQDEKFLVLTSKKRRASKNAIWRTSPV